MRHQTAAAAAAAQKNWSASVPDCSSAQEDLCRCLGAAQEASYDGASFTCSVSSECLNVATQYICSTRNCSLLAAGISCPNSMVAHISSEYCESNFFIAPEGAKGWGLQSMVSIPPHMVVQEYRGEEAAVRGACSKQQKALGKGKSSKRSMKSSKRSLSDVSPPERVCVSE